jgi:hypothetical protein
MWRFLQYAQQADTFTTSAVVKAMGPAVGVSLCATVGFFLYTSGPEPVGGWALILQAAGVLFATWSVVLVLQFKQLKRGLKILGK